MDMGAEAAAVRLLLEVKANNNTISPVNGQRVIKASEPGHIAEIAEEDGGITLQSVILYGQTGVRRTKAAQKQRIQRGTQFAVTEQARKSARLTASQTCALPIYLYFPLQYPLLCCFHLCQMQLCSFLLLLHTNNQQEI